MDIMKIIGVAFVVSIASILLKSTKPEISFVITIAGVIVILLLILDSLDETIAVFQGIASATGMENGLIKILLKIIGVGYVTEFGASILNDFGSSSIANKVILGGKITIVLLSAPIFENLLNLMSGFLRVL
jgi:stage III sporulation protein AD